MASNENKYVTEIQIITGNESVQPPSGFIKIPVDINKKAGGKFVYICYQLGTNRSAAITNIVFVKGKDAPAPTGYTKIDLDLNKGVGGKYIYLCYTRNPICGLEVITGKEDIQPSSGYAKIPQDLNEGAGGEYVYLCTKSE